MYAHDPRLPDELRRLLDRAGMFVTAYFDVSTRSPELQWADQRSAVEEAGLSDAVAAIDVAAATKIDEHTAGWAVIASEDGSTLVVESPDPPKRPHVKVGALPYLAPILEWRQNDVPHLVVSLADALSPAGEDAAADVEILPFSVVGLDDPIVATSDQALHLVAELAEGRNIPLVIVVGPELVARSFATQLRRRVPIETSIRTLSHPGDDLDGLADDIVRAAATERAVETVRRIREFRFERSHANVAEGATSTMRAVASGSPRMVLVHDDPSDHRTVLSSTMDQPVRLVDAVIAAALFHGIDVHIMPAIDDGPRQALGAVLSNASAPAGQLAEPPVRIWAMAEDVPLTQGDLVGA